MLIMSSRKDDYAFFLHPVDPSQVPGYSDVIARPMDLGTMTTKVEKGKYRSLEEFAVRLLWLDRCAHKFSSDLRHYLFASSPLHILRPL